MKSWTWEEEDAPQRSYTEDDVRQLALRYQSLGMDIFPYEYFERLARRYFEEPHIVRGEN